MGLEKQLQIVTSSYLTDMRLIGEFISDIEDFLTEKQNRKPPTSFTEEEATQLRHLGEAVLEAAKRAENLDNTHGKNSKDLTIRVNVTDRVGAFALQLLRPIKQRRFLAEMSLSYLIAFQEAFIKDYLYVLLTRKLDLLKSNAPISYAEVVGHRSVRTLWSTLAQKEVDTLGYGSIDDVGEYFSRRLGIPLSSYKNWEALREHSYRRNLVIHNGGKINDVYRRKVKRGQRTGTLTTEVDYVASAVENVIGFVDFVHTSIINKFVKKARSQVKKAR